MHFGEFSSSRNCKREVSRYCPKRQRIGEIDLVRRQIYGETNYGFGWKLRFGQLVPNREADVLIWNSEVRRELRACGFRAAANLPRSCHRVEGARDDLRRPRPVPIVGGFQFEQFGMRQDDPQLVIQLVEQPAHFGTGLDRQPGRGVVKLRREVHARPAVCVAFAAMTRVEAAASRHSVSAKMRMDPPAVRTYSTLPAEIQL